MTIKVNFNPYLFQQFFLVIYVNVLPQTIPRPETKLSVFLVLSRLVDS